MLSNLVSSSNLNGVYGAKNIKITSVPFLLFLLLLSPTCTLTYLSLNVTPELEVGSIYLQSCSSSTVVVVVAIKMNWFPFNFPQSHEIFGTHSYTLKWAQNAVTIGLRNQTIAAKTLPSSSHDDIGSNQCNNDKRHLLDPR